MSYIRKTADIITSNELDFVLHQIKDHSLVAKLLLKQRHPIEDLVDGHVNYISISNSDKTKISYLTKERAESIIQSSPYGEGADELWSSSRRFHVKPGSFISKIFKKVSLEEVQKFSILFRNIQNKIEYNFNVVDGSKLSHYYHFNSYLSESGSLGCSCMKYDQCQDYLDLYTKNSDIIKMLVMTADNGQLIGRALLWEFNGNKIMDRIYTIDDDTYQYQFKKWADNNEYLYKKEQKWNNGLFFESNGKTIYKELSVKLENTKFEYYPYLDTFRFLDTKTGTLYNYKPTDTTTLYNIKTLSSADGSTYGYDHLMLCDKTKQFFPYADTTYLEYCGIRVCHNICVYSDIFDTSILREDALYDPNVNDWIFKDPEFNNEILLDSVRKTKKEFGSVMENFYQDISRAVDETVQIVESPF